MSKVCPNCREPLAKAAKLDSLLCALQRWQDRVDVAAEHRGATEAGCERVRRGNAASCRNLIKIRKTDYCRACRSWHVWHSAIATARGAYVATLRDIGAKLAPGDTSPVERGFVLFVEDVAKAEARWTESVAEAVWLLAAPR